MDLNHLLHDHQTVLMRIGAAASEAERDVLSGTLADLRFAIGRQQCAMGATFPLVGCPQ